MIPFCVSSPARRTFQCCRNDTAGPIIPDRKFGIHSRLSGERLASVVEAASEALFNIFLRFFRMSAVGLNTAQPMSGIIFFLSCQGLMLFLVADVRGNGNCKADAKHYHQLSEKTDEPTFAEDDGPPQPLNPQCPLWVKSGH